MAIKNTALGGTDWTNEEAPSATDLNDTIDAAVNKIQTLSAFWLNSDLYDVYDDFDSETTGALSTNSRWEIASGGVSVVESTNAGGSNKEVYINASRTSGSPGTTERTFNSLDLDANKHTFFRIYHSVYRQSDGSYSDTDVRISIDGGSNYDQIAEYQGGISGVTFNFRSNVLIVANGSDQHSLYINGKFIRQVTNATFQIMLSCRVVQTTGGSTQTGHARAYIDDVRQSKSTIS